MKKRYILPIAAAVLAAAGAVAASPQTYNTKQNSEPTRFRHQRPAPKDGFVRVPGSMPAVRVPMRSSSEGNAELVANSLSSEPGFGMYSFSVADPASWQKTADTPAFFGGAVYANGKYYGCDYDYDNDYNLTYVRWYVYDALTWHREKLVENPLNFTYIATDRTYDPSTGTVYSISYDRRGQGIWLSTTDLETGAPTMINALEKDVTMLACSGSGQLYGIDTAANLYKIDKTNAALTLVGNTKIYEGYSSDYTQSITFDDRSGKIYWAEFHTIGLFTSVSNLFEVDPATAQTRMVYDLPENPELTGLYVADYFADDVPAGATSLTAVPASEGSLSYTLGYTAPSKTVDGTALSGNLEMVTTIDDVAVDTRTVAAGSAVSISGQQMTRGLRTMKVTATGTSGKGATVATMFYAGYDVPAAPHDVTLTYDGTTAHLSWTAPTEGADGGALRGPLTYRIVRMPDETEVCASTSATTFDEPVNSASRYTYKVSAVSPDGEGPAAESNGVIMGAYDIPYVCSFDTQEEFDVYTIVDVLSDGRVWNYDAENQRLRHPWSMYGDIDDYIITPPLKMNAANSYSIVFDAYQMVASYNEHVMLYFGDTPDPTKMTLLIDTEQLSETPTQFTATVAPTHDGIHYFAFRSQTGRNGFMSYVDDIAVRQKGSSNVPAAIRDFKAEAAAGGVEEVNISLTVPATTLQGEPLSGVNSVIIYRGQGDEPLKVFDAPQPGEALSWTDTSVTTGKYTYRAVVTSPNGNSEPATAAVYVGIDIPQAPKSLTVTAEGESRVISWEAPAAGVNGGNLDGLLSYRLTRVVNDESEVIADGLTATEYTDTWTSEEQAFLCYSLTAVTSAGESESVVSDTQTVGKPYPLPYTESFSGGSATTAPWSVENVYGSNGSWAAGESGDNPYCKAQDADNGLATFDGYHTTTRDCQVRLISPNIDISGFSDPVLTFYIYQYDGKAGWWQEEPDPVGETMQVEISVNGARFETIPGSDIELYSSTSGWKEYRIDLSKYRKSPGVRIAFLGKSAGNFNIHLDNIRIAGTMPDVGVQESFAPTASVRGAEGAAVYSGMHGGVKVYDTAGRLVGAKGASEGRIALPAGIYLVTGADSIHKIIVK